MTAPLDRRWIDAASRLGVPSVIAIFLIWWLTSVVAASLSEIKTSLGDHVTATNIYLRAVCLHTAKTEAERAECPMMLPKDGR